MIQQDKSIVQHRFVQIQQITTLIEDQTDKLWQVLDNSDLPTIVISNACEYIVKAVSNSKLEYLTTIQHIQSLVLSSKNDLHISVFLQCITQLLIWKEVQTPYLQQQQQHPFVYIIRQKPELYSYISVEIDSCFEQSNNSGNNEVFQAFLPLFDAILLMDLNSFSVNPIDLINKITILLNDRTDEFLLDIVDFLLDICRRYPSKYPQHSHLVIIDMIINTLTYNKNLHSILEQEDLTIIVNDLIYQLLQCSYNASIQKLPFLLYIKRLEKVIQLKELIPKNNNNENEEDSINNDIYLAMPNFYIVWCSLSYLLLSAQTMDDQFLIISIMQFLLNLESPSNQGHICYIALLPLFQTLAESQDNAKLKKITLSLISDINNRSLLIESKDKSISLLKKINEETKVYEITGGMAYMISHLCKYLGQYTDQYNESIAHYSSLAIFSSTHSILFCIPLLFNDDFTLRHTQLSQIIHLSTNIPSLGYLKFSILLILLHLMRHPVATSDTLLYILKKAIPSLASVNDPITTTKAIQITISLINDKYQSSAMVQAISHTSRETTMTSIGIKVLAQLCETNSRIWQELKKILSEWVLKRKSNNGRGSSIDVDNTGTIQVELSILTTMRDLCYTHPQECALDILPMIISLLQSVQYVHVGSLSIMVQTMCGCIQANLTEARSMWIVALSHIAQFAMNLPTEQTSLLLRRLCEFFKIVGEKDENSEVYIEFKQTILDEYLVHLIHSRDESVKSSALDALSSFAPADIATLIPERSKQYLDEIMKTVNNGTTSKSYSKILVALMNHELDHMRRGYFSTTGEGESKSSLQQHNGKGKTNQFDEGSNLLATKFFNIWENAHVSPGLRSGYATTILYGVKYNLDAEIGANTLESIVKTKWYRCMMTSIVDISLIDHLIVRVANFGAWKSFFNAVLVGNEGDIENRALLLLKDLLTRLDKSTVPGQTCNIFLALTGMVMKLYEIIPSCATKCAVQLIDVIITKYLTNDASSILISSEEVQYAARTCLGYISECIVINDKMTTDILNHLLRLVTKCRSTKRELDLIHFSSGFSAARLSSILATWPTKSSNIEVLSVHGNAELINYCNGDPNSISESACLGIMMGWASRLNDDDMKTVYGFAKKQLEGYRNGRSINQGILLGAPWVCAYGIQDFNHGDEILNLLTNVASIAAKDEKLVQHIYHFDIPLAKISRLHLINNNKNESSSDFNKLFLSKVQTIHTDDSSSRLRIPAALSLGTLLGTDYLHTFTMTDIEQLEKEANQYDTDTRKPLLDILTKLSGVENNQTTGNLKCGRISTVICGEIVYYVEQLKSIQNQASSSSMASAAASTALLSSSAEPKTYGRLNNNTSYLRALFDSLSDVIQNYQNANMAVPEYVGIYVHILLSSLHDTDGPLPPVNWFPILNQISKVSNETRILCFTAASKHAATSVSLSEYVLSELGHGITFVTKKESSSTSFIDTLVDEAGIGKLLDLSGLINQSNQSHSKRRGMDAVTKKMSISDVRALEVLESYIKSFSLFNNNTQKIFLATLKNHLPNDLTNLDESKKKYTISIQNLIKQNITYKILDDVNTEKEIICLSINISVFSMETLFQNMDIKDWLLSNETAVYNKVISMMELLKAKTSKEIQRWMTDIIIQLIFLFGKPDTTITNVMANEIGLSCWDILSDTLNHHQLAITNEKNYSNECFGWTLRLLDILIIINGTKDEVSSSIYIKYALCTVIRQILSKLWSQSLENNDQGHYHHSIDQVSKLEEIQLAETNYLLVYSITEAKETDYQKQIVRRIFKIIELFSDSKDDKSNQVNAFFIQVLRDCPKEVMENQEESISSYY